MGAYCSVVSAAPPPSAAYFDTVPPEVAQNILRFVSKTPRAVRWEDGVRIRDAISILKTGGILADVARAQFVAVNTNPKKCGYSDEDDEKEHMHGVYASNVRAFRRLLQRGRPIVQTAYISVHYNPRAWSRALQISCRDLRTLCLTSMRKRFPLAPVLKAAAIGEYCVQLKKLRLRCDAAWSEIGALWEGIGNTLEDLALSVVDFSEPGEWSSALNLIRMFCPSIRNMEFDMIIEWQSFTQFCISYGDQLKVLKLLEFYTEPSCYADIVAGCSKVKIDTKIATDLLIPSIKALGSHLDVLRIMGEELDTFDFDIQQLQQVSQACTNLQTLALYPEEIGSKQIVDILDAILADKKPSLERIEIHERTTEMYGAPVLPGAPTTHDILSAVGNRTGHLRHFVFACYMPEVGVFDEIAKKNLRLETVRIVIFEQYRDDEEEEEPSKEALEIALEGIVKSFTVCPNLTTLLVDYMGCLSCEGKLKKVAEYCRKLRNRSLSIKMLEEAYLE